MRKYMLGCSLLLMSCGCAAMGAQPLDTLERAATAFLSELSSADKDEVRIIVNPPDRRLKLSLCRQSLAAFLPPGARTTGNLTVGVRCRGAKPWTVYLSARIQRFARILVAARTIQRGATVLAADVVVKRHEISNANRRFLSELGDVVGNIATRTIQASQPLATAYLRRPNLVRRGQRVMILAGTSVFQVRMEGEALGGGALGETISVKNLRSKRRVQGVVEGRNRVRVPM